MKLRVYQNYLSMINGLPGSKMFQNLYAEQASGEEKNITESGRLSCAYTVSSVLKIFNLIDNPHATVQGTTQAALQAGWFKTDKPVAGSLVVWPKDEDGHTHIGFYIDNEKYISNSTKLGVPKQHGSEIQDGLEPELYLSHRLLEG